MIGVRLLIEPLKSTLKRCRSPRSVREEKESTLNSKPTGDAGSMLRDKHHGTPIKPGGAIQDTHEAPVRKVLQAACKAFGLDYDRYGLSSLGA